MIVQTFSRPWAKFNPTNRDHRQWFSEFLKNNSWGHCPVRFMMDDEGGANLVGLMHNRLIEYYINQEFGQIKVDKAA